MNVISLQYKNQNDLMLLLLLAKRMGITPLSADKETPNGIKMAEALQKLANVNAFAHIKNPVQWQRNLRKDRKLVGR